MPSAAWVVKGRSALSSPGSIGLGFPGAGWYPSSMRRAAPGHFHTLEPFLDLFKTGVPILMYHKIGARPPHVRLRGLYVREDLFVQQLEELQQAGFTTCPPAEANLKARSHGLPARRVVLTFDDGFRNAFQNALAPLAQKQFRAIQFLVVNCIGKFNQWDLRDGEAQEPLMDTAQVGEWLRAGTSHRLAFPEPPAADPPEPAGRAGGDFGEQEKTGGHFWRGGGGFLLSLWGLERSRAGPGDGGRLSHRLHHGLRRQFCDDIPAGAAPHHRASSHPQPQGPQSALHGITRRTGCPPQRACSLP